MTTSTKVRAPELIIKKRDGGALLDHEVQQLVAGYVDGSVTDYQMSAFAMAVFFRGMTPEETTALTLAMRDSGTVVDMSSVPGPKVDKHSTGGVGDKVSICLAPLVTACGVKVPMVSGRGLGHTGGTLDKLEAIPGFSVSATVPELVAQVRDLGCALIGQTADIAPADKKLYALRDVTGTVESIPLITSSILAKKLAEGIDALVLDVKVGRGAFMKSLDDARALAHSIVRVGTLAGKRVAALLTSMDQPLGRTVGNGLETAEAFEVLTGGGPVDLVDITVILGSEMLQLGGIEHSASAAEARIRRAIADGSGAACMERIVAAQGGDSRCVREPDRLPRAPVQHAVRASRAGYVQRVDALEIGLSAVALGAGRSRSDESVDPAVGLVLDAKIGDRVDVGDVLAVVHARDTDAATRLHARVEAAFQVGDEVVTPAPLVLEAIRG